MPSSLAQERCYNHRDREAVARCPECTRFFCRECITEHDDRVLCAACLRGKQQSTKGKRVQWGLLMSTGQFVLAILILWLFFYYLGQALLVIPTSFHDGTLWNSGWWEGK